MSFQYNTENKNLITVFYECGSGGEFLVYLLGMHPFVSARNFSVDSLNRWAICDNFCRMAGRGLEDSLDNWQMPPNYKWYITRDHANLLYPTDKWKDKLGRDLQDGIRDFNNFYSNYWKKSKTIWLDIDTIDDLRFIDRLGAYKNFQTEHIHYTENEYVTRFNDIKQRLIEKRKNFTGDYLTVNVNSLWHNDTKRQLQNIIDYLELDKCFFDIWLKLIDHWNTENNKINCSLNNCVPISL
jgi:hypothetical protein